MIPEWMATLSLLAACGLIAAGSVFVLAALQSGSATTSGAIFADRSGGTSFLFDGEHMIDATPAARALLAQSESTGSAWHQLLAFLAAHFPDVELRLNQLPELGKISLNSETDDGLLLTAEAEFRGGLTRISLLQGSETNELAHDGLVRSAQQEELFLLRNMLAGAPLLVWRENLEGEVVWANARYLNEATPRLAPGQDLTWPLPRLFEPRSDSAPGQRRHQLTSTDGRERWFDITQIDAGSERLLFAQAVDGAVQAETALREFTQTLTKTFAHLPIGLAIFDRQRQLVLFNPALLDLSSLPPDFLSSRPTLFAFLDAMREHNMIPEPRDYRSWRKQMTDIEKAASSHFDDTWSLPSGQTYRLTGRPHPNGALALMFEDISTEISRIRRYRADIELGQSVIDTLDDALAVFSSGGALVMSNAAYISLWGHDPAASLSEGTLPAVVAHWRDASAPTAFWTEAETFCDNAGRRDVLFGEIRLRDGRLIACRFMGLPGGATIARFSAPDPLSKRETDFGTGRELRSA